MKSMKKILALLLSIMLISTMLVGCGDKETKEKEKEDDKKTEDVADKTIVDVFGELSAIEKGVVDLKYEITFPDDEDVKLVLGTNKLTITVKNYTESKTKAMSEIGMEFGETTIALTDIVMMDDMYYINTAKIIDAVKELAPSMATNLDTIKLMVPEEYASISQAQIKQLVEMAQTYALDGAANTAVPQAYQMNMTDNTAVTVESFLKALTEDDINVYVEILTDVLGDKLTKAMADVKPSILGKDGDKYTVTVNNENFKDMALKLADLVENEGVTIFNDLLSALKEKKGEDDYIYTSMNGVKDQVQGAMGQLAAGLKEDMDFEDIEFEMVLGTSVTGKEGSKTGTLDMDFVMKSKDDQMKFVLTSIIDEAKTEEIVVPEKSTSVMDIITSMMQAGSSSAQN